ncbi:Bug family tripartite tricarboxylate transporter substrate binding protein [Teichococcus vastitatis]|uniref:Tripartite tricarboxylate transporter substrate binding protein n=1 Tax=Teichococcus vastitatis TaxID=2307076 RepID=A0ABS9W6R7_9PROT|nr:tripartite tricarboxylate transporter substrate binding protein [Pseudoroseomonas vastitatis]MCI0754916.1 tripartite tricarboxylate transporter substrate binding protein [Pseudoroseomonas vastitatis]
MTFATRRALLASLAAVPLLAPRGSARAQSAWPDRPIRLVVPFGAGTTTDALGRILASALAKEAGQPVVVENRVGAGGNVGAQAVAHAAGDGYTLLLGTNGTHGINASLFADPGFDAVKDFTPIAPFVTTPSVLGVPASLKASSVAELVALAKAKSLSFASAGNGTTGHLSQALLNLRAGLETQHIPYRNAGQAITDLLAGRVDAMFYHPLGLKPHLDAGTVKALAVTSAQRIAILPDVPTMQEAGVQDFVVEGRWSLYGPAGMPAEIVARLSRATNALLADQASLANLRAQGVEPLGGSPEQLAAMTRQEIAKWQPVIAAANIRPD